jgi:hypothetical protein
MEFLAFLGAIIGLIAAIINRKQIVIHTTAPYQQAVATTVSRQTITVGKRLKRAGVALGLGFGCVMLAAMFEPGKMGGVSAFAGFAMLTAFVTAAYQVLAVLIMVIVRLWR